MRDPGREWLRRLMWLGIMAYVGSMAGMQAFAGWRPQWHLANPIVALAAIMGAVITPGANAVLAIVAILSLVYVRTRVPIWTCIVLFVGYAVVSYWVVRGWSVVR